MTKVGNGRGELEFCYRVVGARKRNMRPFWLCLIPSARKLEVVGGEMQVAMKVYF